MNLRSIIVCTLALAAIAGSVISGLAFLTPSPSGLPAAWLFDVAACFLALMLGYTIRGGTHSIAILLATLAMCLPAAGLGLAALIALAIHFIRPAEDQGERFRIGNPVTSGSRTTRPQGTLGRPLACAIRRLEPINQFRLLTGVTSLPPRDSRHVLLRQRDSEDPSRSSCLPKAGSAMRSNAPSDTSKRSTRRARSHPGEVASHCAIAEIHLYLLEQHLVEEDARPDGLGGGEPRHCRGTPG